MLYMSNISDIIQRLAGRQEATLQICVVDSVDRAARTVDCSPLNEGAPLLGCNLQACQESQHGLVVYPKVGSYDCLPILGEENLARLGVRGQKTGKILILRRTHVFLCEVSHAGHY